MPLSLALIGDRVEMAQRQVALSRYLVAVIIGQLAGRPSRDCCRADRLARVFGVFASP